MKNSPQRRRGAKYAKGFLFVSDLRVSVVNLRSRATDQTYPARVIPNATVASSISAVSP